MALPVVGHRHHDLVPRVVVGHALLAVVHLDDRVGVGARLRELDGRERHRAALVVPRLAEHLAVSVEHLERELPVGQLGALEHLGGAQGHRSGSGDVGVPEHDLLAAGAPRHGHRAVAVIGDGRGQGVDRAIVGDALEVALGNHLG